MSDSYLITELAETRKLLGEALAIVEAAKILAYEIEGGNRWPVEWDDDTRIMPALKAFKALCPLPEWKRAGSGFKRAAIARCEAKK